MGRRPGRRRDDSGSNSATSSVSFQIASDEASVNSATDMTDLDVPPSPSRTPKRPCRGPSRGRGRRARPCFTELTGPSKSSTASSTTRLPVASSVRVNTGRTAGNLDDDSVSESDDEDSDSSSDNSDSNPNVETDQDESSSNGDNGYSEPVKIGIHRMHDRWEW
jgi:hypothetical protein